MTPDQVLDILNNPSKHDLETIYETRSSNPTVDDELLTPQSQPQTEDVDNEENELDRIEIDLEEEEN